MPAARVMLLLSTLLLLLPAARSFQTLLKTLVQSDALIEA
jgi:hypothetical protein